MALQNPRKGACSMTVKAPMPVRTLNLVAPLPHKGTAMRTTDTAASVQARSGAVSPLIGASLRRGDVDSANERSTPATTPGTRTSTTATRTTTTRSSRRELAPSADYPFNPSILRYCPGLPQATARQCCWKSWPRSRARAPTCRPSSWPIRGQHEPPRLRPCPGPRLVPVRRQ